jgi:ADP-ribose pyrophosphatase
LQEEQWQILDRQTVLDTPYLKVEMQQVRLPDGRVIEQWPIVDTRDYVNAVVLNQAGEAMIIEGYKHGLGRSNWQVLGGYLEKGEEPLAAVQRELREETGYHSEDWQHLGTFVVDANRRVGTGHFYLARQARSVQQPDHDDLEKFAIHWVSLAELQQAVSDGRVAIISYAVNIALALLALHLPDPSQI